MTDRNIYQTLMELLADGEPAAVLTFLRNPVEKTLYTASGPVPPFAPDSAKGLATLAREVITVGQPRFIAEPGQEPVLAEPYYPEPRLVILGGGHVGKPLAELGAKLGFAVTVADDRPAFASRSRFPKAREVICETYDQVFSRLRLDRSTFLIIVTRGHQYDLDCLRQALQHDLAYLGMIGSRRRVQGVKDLLLSEGLTPGQLERVHSPIGLAIGAVTPEEIAVSILAQIICVRRLGQSAPAASMVKASTHLPEFDRRVLEELARDAGKARAVVTVVSVKGSAPRSAGAKMIVWPDGRIVGTIGGGCTEAEAIRAAREAAAGSGYRLLQLDLTAEPGEEGMACGGVMEVLIEPGPTSPPL